MNSLRETVEQFNGMAVLQSSHQNPAVRNQQSFGNPADLLGGLSLGEDHFGKSVAQRTMSIDCGKAKILQRGPLQSAHSLVQRALTALQLT